MNQWSTKKILILGFANISRPFLVFLARNSCCSEKSTQILGSSDWENVGRLKMLPYAALPTVDGPGLQHMQCVGA